MMKIIIPCILNKFALIWPFLPDTNLYSKSNLNTFFDEQKALFFVDEHKHY